MIQDKERSWDVLYCVPSSKDDAFYQLHKYLCDHYGMKWHFPEYHPHITIAYLKYGTAQKYVNMLQDKPITVQATNIQWKKFQDKEAPVLSYPLCDM